MGRWTLVTATSAATAGATRCVRPPGDDRVRGGRADDTLNGGQGNDRITSVDGVRDVVRCGPGLHDRVVADRRDRVVGCERMVRR